MSASDILRRFAKRDVTSDESRRTLDEFLRSPCYGYFLKTLRGPDTLGYANFLDKASTEVHSRRSGVSSAPQVLDSIPTTERLWTSCLDALRQICGDQAILPTTHVLSRGLIKRRNASMTTNDIDDCWEAQYKRRAVRVRRLRPPSDQVFMKVLHYCMSVMGCALTSRVEILSRGCALEEVESPERYFGPRRDDGSVPSRLRPSI